MAYTTLLLDDEPLALDRLRRLLAQYPDDFTLVGQAQNGEEGRQMIESLRPQVIFLDIEMPVLNGFEMLARLQHLPYVIFATAYENYAIRAFEENSLDYLLKPIEPERLALTVQKIRRLHALPATVLSVPDLLAAVQRYAQPKTISTLTVKLGDKIVLIRLDEITFFEAEDKYVYLHTQEGKKYLLDDSLTTLEAKLPEPFLRVSRSAIVNGEKVAEMLKFFNGRYVLQMTDKPRSQITTGSTYLPRLKAWLGWG